MKLGLSSTTRRPVRIDDNADAPASAVDVVVDDTLAPASQVVLSEEITKTKKRSKKKRAPRP